MRNALVVAIVAVAASEAHAQPAAAADSGIDIQLRQPDIEQIEKVILGGVRRARRAITFGPLITLGATYVDRSGELPLGGGLGFGWYRVPIVPDKQLVLDVIRARVKARVIERIKIEFAGGQAPPPQQEIDRLVTEVLEGVKAEVLGEMNVRARRFERPKFAASLEVVRWPYHDAWELRATLGAGIGRTLWSATVAGHADESLETDWGFGFMLGAEIGLPVQLSLGPRSHPATFFTRFEIGIENTDNLMFGVRQMFDLI